MLHNKGFIHVYPATFLNQAIPQVDHQQINDLIPLLYDEESVNILKKIAQKRADKEISYLDIMSPFEQYFDKSVFGETLLLIKNYIDLGLNTERTILKFMNFSEFNYHHIWGYEPNPSTYKSIYDFFKNKNCGVDIIPKAISNTNGKRCFNSRLGGSSHLDPNGESRVHVTTLDNEFLGKNMCLESSFIKMDIEGEELKALIGAQKFILLYRPILAISVYHEYNHLWEIPKFIKSLIPNYKLFLRHYGAKYSETILYAI